MKIPAEKACFDDLLDIRTGNENLRNGSIPSWIEKLSTREEWEEKKSALQEIFLQGFGRTPAVACDLDPKYIDEVECEGYIKRKVSYAVEPDERLTAYLLIPKGITKKVPGILCIHPTTPFGKEQTIGNDPSAKGQDRAYALHLVRRGYVTLAWDLMSAGERTFEGLQSFDTAPFYRKHPEWSAVGKDFWDLQRAIDFLETVDEVDTSRIGSIGHSQGGGITIHAMALEERIKVGVSSCGSWPSRLSKNPFNNARKSWWVGRPLLRPYCLTGKDFPVDIHELLGIAAPRAILFLTALNDCGYEGEEEIAAVGKAFQNLAENVEKVFSLYGAKEKFTALFHTKGHSFLQEERKVAYSFFDRYL
ncbi:MAG: alpha/beta hydrolase family protein [Candidatus Ratteibacteria bacterium]|jgi:dienelactone hydrolase